jgi:hypothetical protein
VSVFRNDPQKVALEKYLQLLEEAFSEKSGAKGRKPYHHGREGVSTSRSALLEHWGEQPIYPFRSQMAKVEL